MHKAVFYSYEHHHISIMVKPLAFLLYFVCLYLQTVVQFCSCYME